MTRSIRASGLYDESQFRYRLWVEQELARYSYKPNFTLRLAPPDDSSRRPDFGYLPGETVRLSITAQLADSRGRTRPTGLMEYSEDWAMPQMVKEPVVIPIAMTVVVPVHFEHLPPAERSDYFAPWLGSVLQDFEIHESREWLRRDGAIYDDPHLPGGRA